MMVSDFNEVFSALKKENVKFILVGGIAAIGHGMNHVTNDIDICYERSQENIQALVRALTPSHPQLRTKAGPVPFIFDEKTLLNGVNFTLDTEWGWIDLLGELPGVGSYQDLIARSIKVNFFEVEAHTVSLDDLIQAKKIAGRTKDKLHLLELEAIRELLKQGFLKGDKE